jgi:hypothetical protein
MFKGIEHNLYDFENKPDFVYKSLYLIALTRVTIFSVLQEMEIGTLKAENALPRGMSASIVAVSGFHLTVTFAFL